MSTAPDKDNVKWPMVAAIQHSIPDTLSNLHTALLRHGLHPIFWKNTKCSLNPKPGKKEKDQSKSYCPISLLRTLSKTLQKMVARRLARHTAQDDLFRILTLTQS